MSPLSIPTHENPYAVLASSPRSTRHRRNSSESQVKAVALQRSRSSPQFTTPSSPLSPTRISAPPSTPTTISAPPPRATTPKATKKPKHEPESRTGWFGTALKLGVIVLALCSVAPTIPQQPQLMIGAPAPRLMIGPPPKNGHSAREAPRPRVVPMCDPSEQPAYTPPPPPLPQVNMGAYYVNGGTTIDQAFARAPQRLYNRPVSYLHRALFGSNS